MEITNIILSVSQFLDAVNLVLESREDVAIQGEVTDFKKGKWISFILKDPEDSSLLKCVMGEWTWRRIGIELEDGMRVKITGSAKVNKKYGSFGLWVETIEPLGEGSLKKAYELLVKKLREEGLFDRKRPLPEFIHRIGIISSRHGVVIRDFMNNLDRRGFKVAFVDTRVEGDSAVEGILAAVQTLQHPRYDLDLLVIIRGGGSLESMQAFNNELVARAIFGSRIPIVTGIGHDVDVPIACMVADASASTPTAAAVLVSDSWDILIESLPLLKRRLLHGLEDSLSSVSHALKFALQHMMTKYNRVFTHFRDFEVVLAQGIQRIEYEISLVHDLIVRATELFDVTMDRTSHLVRENITRMERYLVAANPERNLRIGYSIVRNRHGHVVKSIHDVAIHDSMTTQVSDGIIKSTVLL